MEDLDKKPRAISQWIKIAVSISDWTLYGLSAFAAVLLFVDLIWGLDRVPFIQNRIPILTLLALATFFVNSILERKTKIESIEQRVETAITNIDLNKEQILNKIETNRELPPEIQKFYRSLRREFPLFDFLNSAQSEIMLVGTTFYHLIDRIKPMIIAKSKYCDVNVLVLNPDKKNKSLIDGVAALFGEEDAFGGELRRSCKRLLQIQEELRKDGCRLTVKMYSSVPTVNLVMIDPDQPTGSIQVEVLPYKGSANMRPGFLLRPFGKEADLYDLFRTQYKLLWREAKELTIE